jgi:hypothetical protein
LVVATWIAVIALTPVPPLLSAAAAAACCLALMIAGRGAAVRALWFNLALALVAAGVLAWRLDSTDERGRRIQHFSEQDRLFVLDDVLGVRPEPGLRTTASLRYEDEPVYDVVYTIGQDGLRISPPLPEDPSRPCILFFGCSFTFGEGVNDDATLPYQVGLLSKGSYTVRNFAFSGYGPHQMLAAIEGGLVEARAACRPRYAIYQSAYHHVLRSSGKWTWDRHGPRYVLGPDREPIRNGHFDDETGATRATAGESFLARRTESPPEDVGVDQTEPGDVELFHAIVRKSAALLRERYPGLEFHVIYWDAGDSIGSIPLFGDGLADPSIVVHPITTVLPAADDWQAAYKLPHDVHPTAATHAAIAAYIAQRIVGLSPSR